MHQFHNEDSASRVYRMAERNSRSVHISFIRVKTQKRGDGTGLRSESFVRFDYVDLTKLNQGVMCGRPPLRKSFSAVRTLVGCIHVFGLFSQHLSKRRRNTALLPGPE